MISQKWHTSHAQNALHTRYRSRTTVMHYVVKSILLDNTLQGRGAKHFFTSGGELLNIVLIWNSNDGVGWIRPAEHDNVPGTKVPGTSSDYSGSTPRVHIEMDPLRPPVMSNNTWDREWGWGGRVFNINSRL